MYRRVTVGHRVSQNSWIELRRTKAWNLVLLKSSLPLSSKGKVLYAIRAPKKGSRVLFHPCLLWDSREVKRA